jgi:hypothetical protein
MNPQIKESIERSFEQVLYEVERNAALWDNYGLSAEHSRLAQLRTYAIRDAVTRVVEDLCRDQ